MSQSYNKSCMFCKHEIVMSDKGAGKWLPYDLNGGVHECKTQAATGTNRVETKQQLTLEQIDVRLRKVESIVIDPRK